MALDHHGTAGGERRGGVAARDREGEREVARPEHGDRAERDVAQAQVRARQRLALRQGGVDAQVEPFAPADHVGEQLQLADRSAALALDAGARQPGLGGGALHERIAQVHDVGGDGFEEARPLLKAGLAIGVEGLPGQSAGALHLLWSREGEGGLERLAGCRIDGAERPLAARHPLRPNQNVTRDHRHTSQPFLVDRSERNVLLFWAPTRVWKVDRHRRIPHSVRQLFDLPAHS